MTSQQNLIRLFGGDIVETLATPLLLLDGELRIVLANTSFSETFGMNPGGRVGRPFDEVDDGVWNVPGLRRVLSDVLPGQDVRDLEVQVHSPRLGDRTMLVQARRLRHEDASVELVLVAFEDVTDRRELERDLHRSLVELQRSNADLEAFAAVASHDLQEPLRKICAFGERLERACEGQLPATGRDYLHRMLAAAARMRRLIGDLLALAKVRRGAEPFQAVALDGIVTAVLGDLDEAVRLANARVTVAPLPVVTADATQMHQLFLNLIGNALKFRGDRSPVVEVWTVPSPAASTPASPAGVTIVVADNGIGFDPRFADRIFEPFERLHTRGRLEGSGIGLALCRRIVDRHGGTIRAEGGSGEGARFVVHLPQPPESRA